MPVEEPRWYPEKPEPVAPSGDDFIWPPLARPQSDFIVDPFDQIQIAVLDFEAKGLAESEASVLTDRLRLELFRAGNFGVVERNLMHQIFQERGLYELGCTSNECLVQVGQMAGAAQVVGGIVGKFGRIYSISVRLVSVSSGTIVYTAVYDHEGDIEELLRTGIVEIADQINQFFRPRITLLLESPGTVTRGSSTNITWSSSNLPGQVSIVLLIHSGRWGGGGWNPAKYIISAQFSTYEIVTKSSTDGAHRWNVSPELSITDGYRIRVSSVLKPEISYTSRWFRVVDAVYE
jgi:TolB-like protein